MFITVLVQVASPLEQAVEEMFQSMKPQFSSFIAFGQAVGCLGAIFYVFFRVWGHLARAEPIDVFPLLRPFALALCLVFYPNLVDFMVTLGGYLSKGTESFVSDKVRTVEELDRRKDELLKQRAAQEIAAASGADQQGLSWSVVGESIFGGMTGLNSIERTAMKYAVSSWFDEIMLRVSKLIYSAAAIGLKVLSVFFIIVLSITGPLTFGLACFDWFYGGLASWFSRFIHVLLWVPIANIFGGIIEEVHIQMLSTDIDQLMNTPADTFATSDLMLMVFYVIGTAGYLLIPKVASWILESSGVAGGISAVTKPFTAPVAAAGAVAGAGAGMAVGSALTGAVGSAAAAKPSPPPVSNTI